MKSPEDLNQKSREEHLSELEALMNSSQKTEEIEPVENLPEPGVVVTEKNLEAAYGDAVSAFVSETGDTRPFSFEDFAYYCQGLDLETATESDKLFATKILDALVAEGKFKKVGESGDKYKVVRETAPASEPNPATSAEPAGEKFQITEEYLESIYNYCSSLFGNNTFSLQDVSANAGIGWHGSLEDEERAILTETFEILVERGKLQKVGDKYQVARETPPAPIVPVTEPVPAPEIPAMPVENVLEREQKEGLELEIANAESFDELYEALRKAGGVQTSGIFCTADDLITRIELYRKNPFYINLQSVTRQEGLRGKVKRLFQAEKVVSAPEEPQPEPLENLESPTPTPLVPPQPDATEPAGENSLSTAEPLSQPPVPPTTEAVPPEPLPENISVIDQDLEDMKKRAAPYAAAQIAFKNKNRENKNRLYRIASDLAGSVGLGETTEDILNNRTFKHRVVRGAASYVGLEKKTDEIFHKLNGTTPANMMDVKNALVAAETAYIAAKKEKMTEICLAPITDDEIKKIFPDFNREKTTQEEGDKIEDAVLKVRAMDQAEEEWKVLQKTISESVPPLEKGIVGKAFAGWAKMPLSARIAASTVVMTGVGMTFGFVTLGGTVVGAGGVLAYRGARSLGGAFAGIGAGKLTDIVTRKTLERKSQKNLAKYAEGLTSDNYELKEKELMSLKEKEENRKKRGILKKAGAMMVVGAGVSIGTDFAVAHHLGSVPGAMPKGQHGLLYKIFHRDNAPKAGNSPVEVVPTAPKPPAALDTVIKPKVDTRSFLGRMEDKILDKFKPRQTLSQEELSKAISGKIAPPKLSGKADELFRQNAYENNPELAQQLNIAKPPIPAEAPIVAPPVPEAAALPDVSVELDKLGFIKTFQNLKHELSIKYPDANATDVPVGVKHFLNTPSTKLAQEYGFWDTKAGTSAMGLHGEHLGVDVDGNLKLEHLATAGKPPMTETIGMGDKNFEATHADKMFVPKTPAPQEVAPVESAQDGNYLDNSYKPFGSPVPKPVEQFDASDWSRAKFNHDIVGQNPAEHLQNATSKTPFSPIYPKDGFGQDIIPGAKIPEAVAGAQGVVEFDFHSALNNADLHVRVAEVAGGGKQILVGDTPIADTIPVPGGTRMQLFEAYQNGAKFKDLREAFVAAQEKLNLPPPYGASAGHRLLFNESGAIDVIHGAPNDPNAVQVLLNGKEIAKGLATVKGPKLMLDPTLHHPFLMADTVFDRAFKFLEKSFKLKSGADVLKDLTLPKVIHK